MFLDMYFSASSSRMTGMEIFSTTIHWDQCRGVTWKINWRTEGEKRQKKQESCEWKWSTGEELMPWTETSTESVSVFLMLAGPVSSTVWPVLDQTPRWYCGNSWSLSLPKTSGMRMKRRLRRWFQKEPQQLMRLLSIDDKSVVILCYFVSLRLEGETN